jgi:hypothetical protein
MCPTGGSDEQSSNRNLSVEYENIDLGAVYRVSDATRLGVMFKNIIGFSLNDEYSGFAVPKYATIALSYTKMPSTLSLDNEYIFGKFGGDEKNSVNIWLLRGGIERQLNQHIFARTGLIYPIMAETSPTGDLKKSIPWPGAGASLGLGLVLKRFHIDLALYGDPGRSYVEQSPTLGATATLTYTF